MDVSTPALRRTPREWRASLSEAPDVDDPALGLGRHHLPADEEGEVGRPDGVRRHDLLPAQYGRTHQPRGFTLPHT